MKTPLKPFNVAIRVFDPTKGIEGGQDYVLPVDNPASYDEPKTAILDS